MKALVALTMAFGVTLKSDLLLRSMRDPEHYAMQFGSSGAASGWTFASIGEVVPPILGNWRIDPRTIEDVIAWNAKRLASSERMSSRVLAGLEFLHHGIVADEIERFVHFFITLDALFGERGRVEAEVARGIAALFPSDQSWRKRGELLYNLRSAIVHGECADLEKWGPRDSYQHSYRKPPEADAATLATSAIRGFLELPPKEPANRRYQYVTKALARLLFSVAGRINRL